MPPGNPCRVSCAEDVGRPDHRRDWVALLLPASAVASTVSVQAAGENNEVFYDAGPGEQNRLKVSSDGAVVTLRDPGAE